MKKHLILRVLAGIVGIYCILLGLCLNGPHTMIAGLATGFLDYELPEDSSLVFAARMIGVYMGFFGVTMGLVAWNPIRNRALLTVAVVLLVLRAIQRLVYFDELRVAFGISTQKNWGYVTTMVVLAALFLVFRLVLLRDMKTATPAATA